MTLFVVKKMLHALKNLFLKQFFFFFIFNSNDDILHDQIK